MDVTQDPKSNMKVNLKQNQIFVLIWVIQNITSSQRETCFSAAADETHTGQVQFCRGHCKKILFHFFQQRLIFAVAHSQIPLGCCRVPSTLEVIQTMLTACGKYKWRTISALCSHLEISRK